MRTIKQFIGQANHIYFKMSSREVCKQFYEQAQKKDCRLEVLIRPTKKQPTLSHFFQTVNSATLVGLEGCYIIIRRVI